MSDEIRPFKIEIAQSELDDLSQRLAATRWPEKEAVEDWSQGVPLSKMQELCRYWQQDYDWRRCEALLNGWPQFKTEIDGVDIHFLHIRSKHEGAMPLLLTHGWPGSVLEFRDVIAPLTDPEAHGGKAEDAFHLIIPSLPGYGFSGKPASAGWNVERIARAWGKLMTRLGYGRWVAQGGDWGSVVTSALGTQAPEGCAGVHVNLIWIVPTEEELADMNEVEQKGMAELAHYARWDSGYSKQQSTRPQTVGYALVDSPVGQAAWIYEKMWAWTDNRGNPEDALSMDYMLDNIMLYWLNRTAASSGRLYWESFEERDPLSISIPSGMSIFPREIFSVSKRWAEKRFTNIVHWNELDRGGHFAAWEQPELFVGEMRECFGKMR